MPPWMMRQTATWKRVTGHDGYGEPIYAPDQVIRCRWEEHRRLVRDKHGKEVVSEATAFCYEAVQADDVLVYGGREWPVIAVPDGINAYGKVSHREVAM